MPNWLIEFPSIFSVDIKTPIDNAINYMVVNWDPFFKAIKSGLGAVLNGVEALVTVIPWWLFILLVFLATLKISRQWKKAALYSVLLFFIGTMGYWDMMNMTLSIVITSVLISLVLGFPLGVLVASGKRIDAMVRPVLDTMQTMPSFVYMIPAAMLLGLGPVPAVIATTIYAMPPVVRLTSHGIQQVNSEVVEAAKSFGSTRMQTLLKVQIPQAMPTIMTGVNQTIMMAIAMVVTCAMIGAISLGSEVLIGINRLEPGRGFSACFNRFVWFRKIHHHSLS